MSTEIKLTVTFLNKTITAQFPHKIVRVTEGNSYSYYGATKKECIEKAKQAMRYNSSYKKSWSTETFED